MKVMRNLMFLSFSKKNIGFLMMGKLAINKSFFNTSVAKFTLMEQPRLFATFTKETARPDDNALKVLLVGKKAAPTNRKKGFDLEFDLFS